MPAEPIPETVATYLERGWPVVPVRVDRRGGRKVERFLTKAGFNDASVWTMTM